MRRALPVFILLVLASHTAAQERTHDITVDDYFTLKTITEIAVSSDGKNVAYCLSVWNEAINGRRQDLWVVSTDGKGEPKQLTKLGAGYRHPKWAADGKAVYVMANAPSKGVGGAQVWKVPLEGEAEVVTKRVGGIVAYDYAPKADAIFYTADASATDEDDFTKLRTKFPRPEYGSGTRKVSELFRINIGEKDTVPEKLIAEKRYIREFAVTADGQRIAMIAAADDSVIRSEGDSTVDVWDAETKKVTVTDQSWKKTAGSPWPWLESVAWAPNGSKLAYCCIHDAYPAEVIICEWKTGQWPARRLQRTEGFHIHGYGTPLLWDDSMALGGLIDFKGSVGRFGSYIVDGTGPPFPWLDQRTVLLALAKAQATTNLSFVTHVMVAGTAEGFPVLVAKSQKDGKDYLLTDPNPHTQSWKLPQVSHITWKAPDGTSVGGVLELPFGFKKGDKKLPLVVGIHGGPTTANYANQNFDIWEGRTYMSARGYAVLCPNYRGSTGYGDKFITELIGNENDIEVKDILAGIKHLVDEGIVDPDKIGVMGWSNGGYLTNCLITLKDPPFKFKAASSGASILDTVAEWGFNDEPAYPRVFKKGLPWETPDVYRKTSPTYGLGNVTTPTLIHVGGADERCPPGHSRMLHRALKEYVKVPTELIVYPGEPHGLQRYANRKAKMEWDIAWFDKYVLGK